MYSCAIWGEEEGGPRGDLVSGPTQGDLEAAQRRKIQVILKKARIRPGQRLLEIGSGWGAMALEVSGGIQWNWALSPYRLTGCAAWL
jgi:cyclopropane-fatty-acyl-phospholipid synthase